MFWSMKMFCAVSVTKKLFTEANGERNMRIS